MLNSSQFHQGSLTIEDELPLSRYSVCAGTPVSEAISRMTENIDGYLLVTDEQTRPLGLVRTEDLLEGSGQPSDARSVLWMSRPIETLMCLRFDAARSGNKAKTYSEIHAGMQLRCFPLIEDGQLVGVVTQDDVLISTRRLDGLLAAATTDEITQLANRTTFNRRLSDEWNRARRAGDPVTVMLFDVDHFKEVNDEFGHLVGDRVLSQVAQTLRETLRSYDVVSRFGGDEFAALCCRCDSMGADSAIRRLQASLRRVSISGAPAWRGTSLSIGAVTVESRFEHLSVEQVVATADSCLYLAKDNGRDCAYRIRLDGVTEHAPVRVTHEIDGDVPLAASSDVGRSEELPAGSRSMACLF